MDEGNLLSTGLGSQPRSSPDEGADVSDARLQKSTDNEDDFPSVSKMHGDLNPAELRQFHILYTVTSCAVTSDT
jgi:hypothetical protein